MMDPDYYQHWQFQALMAKVIECPGDQAPLLIAQDWLLGNGETDERAAEVFMPPLIVTNLPFESLAGGIGSGFGASDGCGNDPDIANGRGSGYAGRGLGFGGSGRGGGCAWGYGEGVEPDAPPDLRNIRKHNYKDIQMQVGRAYIVGTADWFVWVGRVKRQVGPWEWEFTGCSKISNTNNEEDPDSWQHLATNTNGARERASYIHYPDGKDDVLDAEGNIIEPGVDGLILGMGALWKYGWVGKTPKEAAETKSS